MERATHSSGARGKFGAQDANGFGQFLADSGATFTAHASEIVADSASAEDARVQMALWAGWPKGCLTFKARAGRRNKRAVVRATKGAA